MIYDRGVKPDSNTQICSIRDLSTKSDRKPWNNRSNDLIRLVIGCYSRSDDPKKGDGVRIICLSPYASVRAGGGDSEENGTGKKSGPLSAVRLRLASSLMAHGSSLPPPSNRVHLWRKKA